jgi:hypothetical protein
MGVVALTAVGHAFWSHYYYGAWLPNTYYLKATGWPLLERLPTGAVRSYRTWVSLATPLLLGGLAFLERRRAWQFLLLSLAGLAIVYEVYVGGDWMPWSRFVVPLVPGLLVVAADGGTRLLAAFVARRSSFVGRCAHAVMVLAILIGLNLFCLQPWLLIARPPLRADNEECVGYAEVINRITTPDVTIALGAAGAIPYFAHGRYTDMLGRCDAHIARLPVHDQPRRAGHNKYDSDYTLQTYEPDLLVHGIPDSDIFRRDYLPIMAEVDEKRFALFVRRGTPKVQVTRDQYVTWQEAYDILSSSHLARGAKTE